MECKYFFDHLAKTGGMSMIHIFNSIFGPENVTLPTPTDVGDVEAYLHENKEYKVVAGHVRLKFGCASMFERKVITCLRDPVDRALSSFFYWKNNIIRGNGDIVDLAKDVSLDEFFKTPDTMEYFSGFYINHFSALVSPSPPDTPEECLALAKLALESYDFVGIYEHYRDTVDFMCLNFGWPAVEEIPVINKTSGRQRMTDILPDTLSCIRELTKHDEELYQHALMLFEKRRRALLCDAIRAKSLPGYRDENQEKTTDKNDARETVIKLEREYKEFGNMEISISAVTINGVAGGEIEVVAGKNVEISAYINSSIKSQSVVVGFAINDRFRRHVYGTNTFLLDQAVVIFPEQVCKVTFTIPLNLAVGNYEVSCCVHDGPTHLITCYHWKDLAARFLVVPPESARAEGMVYLDTAVSWNVCSVFNAFRFSIGLPDEPRPTLLEPNTSITVKVNVRNDSGVAVKTTGSYPAALSYHWITVGGESLVFEGVRTPIDETLGSGESRAIGVRVDVPDVAGPCVLRISMVLDGIAWFEHQGMVPVDIPLTISPAPPAETPE